MRRSGRSCGRTRLFSSFGLCYLVGSILKCNLVRLAADIAKRLRLKAQGCFNPGLTSLIIINPERVAPSGNATGFAVDIDLYFTQGSRSGNLGFGMQSLRDNSSYK